MLRRNAVAIAYLALVIAVSTHADERSERRARIFASLPDWTGIWESEAWSNLNVAGRPEGGIEAVRRKSSLSAHPPYNAEWEAQYQTALKAATPVQSGATSKVCQFGFPGAMESPALFQVAITPEETLFVFLTREIRHIHIDGRSHPAEEDRWPTLMGESIGRWEGDTLVIETVARRADAPIRFASPLKKLSDQARFIERVRLVAPDRLENELTIDDPVALSKPWRMTLRYRRVTNLDRLIHYDCAENDRNPVIDGQLSIAPP